MIKYPCRDRGKTIMHHNLARVVCDECEAENNRVNAQRYREMKNK